MQLVPARIPLIGGFLAACAVVYVGLLATAGSTVRAQGLQFDSDDSYAGFPKLERHRAFLPEAVDLSHRFPTPGDQGDQGSCVGWAVGYAARSYYSVAHESRPRNSASDIPSPAYIYGAIKGPGDCDTGAAISRALDLLSSDGVLSLARFPYNQRQCPIPSRTTGDGERQFKIQSWRVIAPGQLDDVKGALSKGNPVIIGSRITGEFSALRGDTVWQGTGQLRPGGHAMTLVGYDERRQAFKVINSWGTKWGNAGFGWIGYEAYRAHVRQAFVMDVAASPLRPPVPAPSPDIPPRVVPDRPGPVANLDPPLASYECADLRLVQTDAGAAIQGYVGSAADLTKLSASAAKAGIRVAVALRAWPQCEVLNTFKETFSSPGAPSLRLVGDRRELAQGDPLVVEVTMPERPSYLYLIYVQASGEVVYLKQPRGSAPSPSPPKEILRLGDGSQRGPKFTVGPPFGEEMILALATASPLLDEVRPANDTERVFLTVFRKALLVRPDSSAEKRDIHAAWLTITTREK